MSKNKFLASCRSPTALKRPDSSKQWHCRQFAKFQSILSFIRCDDNKFRPIRRSTDQFAAIRELLNSVMNNCQKSYFPDADVTVDEQLFSCRLRLVCIYDKQFIFVLHVNPFILIFCENKLKYRDSIFMQMTIFK